MIEWLKTKLGIITIEGRLALMHHDIGEINKYLGLQARASNESQRYDEIERDRKRRKKNSIRVKYT
jgi:hypothetical protein